MTILPPDPLVPGKYVYLQAVAYLAAGSPTDLTSYPLIASQVTSSLTATQVANNTITACGNLWTT